MSWLEKLLPPKIKRSDSAGRGKSTIPEGLWSKCSACEAVLYRSDLDSNQGVCPKCGHHNRLRARQRLDMLLDIESRVEIGAEVRPVDALKFKDSRKYPERLSAAGAETGEADAMVVMQGLIGGVPVVVACFEFEFLGGSMGSVVGERFVRGAKAAYEQRLPFITLLTDPTMGGVSASFAFMGDVVVAEPNALIGFAGPRVIEQTVRETLPEGFQRAEFLLDKGAIDLIVDRRELRDRLAVLLAMLNRQPADVVVG